MSDFSRGIVAALAICTILASVSAGVCVAQEAKSRAATESLANPEPPEFLTGPVSHSGQRITAQPQRAVPTVQTSAPGAFGSGPHTAGQSQAPVGNIPPDTWHEEYLWQEEYAGHIDDVLHGSPSRSQRGTVGDWWRQRLPYIEFATVEPGSLRASAQQFINEHTLPPEHDYDVDIYDQRPISVASSQIVTPVPAIGANAKESQAANNSGTNQNRTDIREIRPTLGYAMRNIDAGQLPEGFNEKLDQGDYTARQSSPAVLQWAPTNLYHHPLYFEDPALERYGHTYHPVVQPFASAGRFATQLVGLPYQMTLHPVHSREYTLGYYRPGECAPKKFYQIPFNEEAAIMQAAAMAGFFLIFP